MEHIRREINIS